MKSKARLKPRVGQWISVKNRLPPREGIYTTLVKPLLEKSFTQRQKYTPISNPYISGWKYAVTTHWKMHKNAQ